MMLTSAVPEWIVMVLVAVPNFAIGVLILVLWKRIRLFIKSLVPRMSEDAEVWTSRVIIVGGLFLMAVPTCLIYTGISSALAR